jgi:hypothetical protein
VDLLDWHRVEVVPFLPALPDDGHEVGGLEHGQVLGHRLAGHIQVHAELLQGLPVAFAQPVEHQPAGGVSKGTEDQVQVRGHYLQDRQPDG